MNRNETANIKHEVKDVFYLLGLQGLNYIAPLLVLPYLMKVLGAEKFGYIGFSLSVMQYLMLIVDFGFNLSATKRIALAKDNPAELNNIFTSTLYAKIGLLIISFFILIVFALIPRFAIYRETMFVMFLMVVGNAFTFVWLFQGLGQIRVISIFNTIAKLSILPLTFIFVKNAGDYMIAAFLQSFVAVFAMVISVAYVMKKRWVAISSFVKRNVIVELREGFPLFLSGAATSVYMASFVVVLGYFSTAEQVGQYSAVDRLMRAMCWLVFTPISQAFYPKISGLGVKHMKDAKLLVRKLLYFVISAMTVLLFSMYFLSPYIVSFLGDEYKDTDVLFKIMAFIPLFIGIAGTVGQLGILALGNHKDKINYQHVYFIAGTIALISMIILIPFYYSLGATIALLITEFSACVLMVYFGRKIIWL